MFSHPKILFLVSLLFVALLNSIPTYLLNFYFFIVLACLLLYMLNIHNNLSAGTQNVTGAYAYVIIMLFYRHLLTTRLHGKTAV